MVVIIHLIKSIAVLSLLLTPAPPVQCRVNATIYNSVIGAPVYSIADETGFIVARAYSNELYEVHSTNGFWHGIIAGGTFGFIKNYDCPLTYPVYLPVVAAPWWMSAEH